MCSVARTQSDTRIPAGSQKLAPGKPGFIIPKKQMRPGRGAGNVQTKRNSLHCIDVPLLPRNPRNVLGRPPTGPRRSGQETALQTADRMNHRGIRHTAVVAEILDRKSQMKLYSLGLGTLVRGGSLISALIQSVGWEPSLLTQNRTCHTMATSKMGWMDGNPIWAKQGRSPS